MEKKIQKYGGSLIIRFNKDEVERYGLVEGDFVDIGDMVVQERGEKQNETHNIRKN